MATTKNRNIRISRYTAQDEAELPAEALCEGGTFAWMASVEPEDGSWVLFVPKDPKAPPSLWVRVGTNDNGDGTGEDVYAAAGSPEHDAFLATQPA